MFFRSPSAIGWLALLLLLVGLGGCRDGGVDYPPRDLPNDLFENVSQVAVGHKLFLRHCASCHGKPGEGLSGRAGFYYPPAPDFTQAAYRQVDPAYLFWRIEVGKNVEPYRSLGSVMPAWSGHLSDQQIWQLVAYLVARAE